MNTARPEPPTPPPGPPPRRVRDEHADDVLLALALYLLAPLALMIVLSGCDRSPPPEDLELVVVEALNPGTFGGDNVATELPEAVAGACDLLELDCSAVPPGTHGAIAIVVVPELFGHTQDGSALVPRGCMPAAWSTDHQARVAHELGGLLGLVEVLEPGNIMHRLGRVSVVEREQIDTVAAHVRELGRCRE